MNLGCFSVSLTVKNIQKSKEFYEALGFTIFHGDESQGWLILKNGSCNLGLFQGMFDKNILTFNPGWTQDAQNMEEYDDIRAIQKALVAKGIVSGKIIENESGPASFSLEDPDGNQILLDQHR
jgi:catechol 2,3-dioxygenase-like lactoylglutathione lyase family enzyme